MPKINIELRDRIVTVDGVSHQIPLTTELLTDPIPDAPVHHIEVEDGRAEVQYGRPMNRVLRGDEAAAYIKPYLDAWSAENEKALLAKAEAEAAKAEPAAQPEGTVAFP